MREMKDSGIEWIGEIPKDWERTKLLNLLRKHISDGPHETPNLLDSGIPFISVDSLNTSENVDLSKCKKFISEVDYNRYSIKTQLEENDILFTKAATIGKTAIVSKEKFMVWSPIAIIKPNSQKAFNKYIYHLLNCSELIKYISYLGSYNTQINVGMRELEQALIPFPPLAEQQKISAYLDDKCTKIDSIIAKQQEVIEKLKAYKQSVITEAVTKGLKPDVKMKDSGVEWIGEIPEKWDISHIKYIANFEPSCDKSKLNETSIITYTPMDCIKNGWFINNKAILGNVSSSLTPYQEGDIVMAKVTPCFENGNIAIMDNLYSGYGLGSSELFVFRPIKIITKYLFYWLQNGLFKRLACSTMTGTGGLKRVSSYFIKNCYIHYPPIEEQQQIADYLDKKCSAIDSAIAKKQALIEKLTEYKKSLIYEVVTGKKEV